MEKKSIGKFIASLRKAKGYTQEELASLLNISNKTISSWENDNSAPDLSLIVVLADIFNVSCDELIRGQRNPKNTEVTEILSNKSEKIKTNLYNSLLNQYKNHVILSIALWIIGLFLAVISFQHSLENWLRLLLLILGIITYIVGLVFSIIMHNNVETKNDKENPIFNRNILEYYTFIKSLYSLFLLTPVFYLKKNNRLLTDKQYSTDALNEEGIHKSKRIQRILYTVCYILIGIIVAVGLIISTLDLNRFGAKYTQDEIAKNEYTFQINYLEQSKTLEIKSMYSTSHFGIFTSEKLDQELAEELTHIPSGSYTFDLFYGDESEYQQGAIELGNGFAVKYADKHADILYKGFEIIYLTRFTAEDGFTCFSFSRVPYLHVGNQKYVRQDNQIQINNPIQKSLIISYILLVGASLVITAINKKNIVHII